MSNHLIEPQCQEVYFWPRRCGTTTIQQRCGTQREAHPRGVSLSRQKSSKSILKQKTSSLVYCGQLLGDVSRIITRWHQSGLMLVERWQNAYAPGDCIYTTGFCGQSEPRRHVSSPKSSHPKPPFRSLAKVQVSQFAVHSGILTVCYEAQYQPQYGSCPSVYLSAMQTLSSPSINTCCTLLCRRQRLTAACLASAARP